MPDFVVELGHEVHLCYRCGWPFPNPHPSAKHRRAHKRVCGTIEGFAINQPKSDDDDDDNSDDDDNNHHAPSQWNVEFFVLL